MSCNVMRLIKNFSKCNVASRANLRLVPPMTVYRHIEQKAGMLRSHHSLRCPSVIISVRQIHVTHPNNALPPLLVLMLRPLAKFSAMLFGRFIRKRWQKLTPEEKQKILNKLKASTNQLGFVGTLIFLIGLICYLDHVFEDPITKRKRFLLYNDEQMKVISELSYQAELQQYKKDIVPPYHPHYQRIARVANKILLSNRELSQIKSKNWAITVVDRPDITNAFVTPHGKIFVFTGMLHVCTNDDQLAVVLAHEISHAILSHSAETLSKLFLVEMLLMIPIVVFWAIFSDVGALFSQWLSGKLADFMIHLPFMRSLEIEADAVGLQLAARACYDVREAPIFWAKMNVVTDTNMNIEWLSTHPSHESRQTELQQLLPEALKTRMANSCPLLGPLNPAQKYYHFWPHRG